LKEKVLALKGMCLYACSLHFGSLIVFLLLERDGLGLESLSPRLRKFDLRESFSLSRNDFLFPTLSDSFLLKNGFLSLIGIPSNEGVGVYL